MVGKLLGIELGFAGGDVLLREPQNLRILGLGFAAPPLESGAGRDACGHSCVEELEQLALVAEQIDAPSLLLQVLHVLEQVSGCARGTAHASRTP